jgi:DNA-binding NarL/FixJ family response regulator
MLRILLVDDHKVVRLGLRTLLDSESDLQVVGEAGNAAEAIQLAGQLQPEVVLLDVRLPDRSGIAACQKIRQQWPKVQVLMLTSFADENLVLEAISAGAAGYVLKQLDTTDLLKAIRAVGQGEAVLDPAVTHQVLQQLRQAQHEAEAGAFRNLSEREVEVLSLVAEGKTNAEIGETLMLSEKTIRNHVSAILEKLNLTNRIEAATYAVRHHIERYLNRR